MNAKYVQPQNNGCPVDKLYFNVILRKILQHCHMLSNHTPQQLQEKCIFEYGSACNKISHRKEYPAFERSALDKHEYYQGEIFAMNGESFKHNLIESNLRLASGIFLKEKECKNR